MMDGGMGRRPGAGGGGVMAVVDRSSAGRDVSDEELMRQLAEGRGEAFGRLHERYAPLVFAVAARTLDRGAAEEVVQEVFLAVWRKAATFDPQRGSFRAWVLRIAHLRVLNELRRRSRRPRLAPDANGEGVAVLPDGGPGAAESAWRNQRRAAVREAIEALPPTQRQALSLAFLEEMTHEQVASSLDLPLGTAKSRIRAGLQALRGRLAPVAAAGLALVGLMVLVGLRERDLRAALSRTERALVLVTLSSVTPLRLEAAPGVPAATHGNYRGRPGTAMAVLTFSNFAPAPAGQVYRAWALHHGRWTALATVHPDAQGRDLAIVETPVVAETPEALKVTLEPTRAGATPTGPTVIRWPGR
jgi:RNA polymerase sigma-70 factor (ECF subfamily)